MVPLFDLVCEVCGRRVLGVPVTRVQAKCANGDLCKFIVHASEATDTTFALGDYTERVLASIGVTKERYVEAKSLFGLAPTCNCPERKEWLNKVGKWIGIGSP